ncbi:carbohydrate kinase family protein [Candidatus Saccharibacteria bacterium]|nr:carbohydrate kinase family protein [Candidatus Saccharibacteria bacterium]
MKNNFEFIAVGDVVTDAFIELLSTEAKVEQDRSHHPLLCMTYGTKIPFQEAIVVPAVGNAANAAVAAARLGLNTGFISDVGNDDNGREMLHSLTNNNVSTEFVRIHHGKHSNYHYVLWYKADRTILIKHEAYDYRWPRLHDHNKSEWLYMSSIAESGEPIHVGLAKYLEANKDVKFAFQPGTFQIREGKAKLAKLYSRAEVFAANKEEFQQILNSNSNDEKILINDMHKLGPKVVLLTDGPKGAFASDGKEVVFMPPYPDPKPPYDRTGAGDAYASTFTAALAQGKDLATGLAWAGVNSMSVVQQVGAQAGLLKKPEIDHWLKKAPTSFKPKLVN